jgi:hypothetical protein
MKTDKLNLHYWPSRKRNCSENVRTAPVRSWNLSLTRVRKPQWTKGGPRGVDMKENIDMRSQVTHFDTTMLAGLGQKPLWRWVGRDNDQMALKSWR